MISACATDGTYLWWSPSLLTEIKLCLRRRLRQYSLFASSNRYFTEKIVGAPKFCSAYSICCSTVMNASRPITKRPLQILRSKWNEAENLRSIWGQLAGAWKFILYVHHLLTNLIERNVFFHHRTKFMMSRPRLHLPVQAMVCVAAFGFGLPLAIALFPQTSQVRSLITKKVYAAYNKAFPDIWLA